MTLHYYGVGFFNRQKVCILYNLHSLSNIGERDRGIVDTLYANAVTLGSNGIINNIIMNVTEDVSIGHIRIKVDRVMRENEEVIKDNRVVIDGIEAHIKVVGWRKQIVIA